MGLQKHSKEPAFTLVHQHAAGIDVGSQFHVVAVSAERDFRSITGDLYRLTSLVINNCDPSVVF